MARKSSSGGGARKKRPAGRKRVDPGKSASASATASGATKGTARKRASSVKAKTPGLRRGNARPTSASAALTKAAGNVGRTLGTAASAVAKRMSWGGAGDAIDLLEADHRRLEGLFDEGKQTTARSGRRRTELLATITSELTVHELIEEKVMYPALKSHAEARDIVLEGYQEHHVANVVLKELQGLPTSDERWKPKFKVFTESIEHHIQEEEGEMFKTARSVMSRAQLDELGARMRAMKAQASRPS